MAENPDSELHKKLRKVEIPYHVLDYADGKFTEEERKYLERQLRSVFAFVGCQVPNTVTLEKVELPLREIVWRLLTAKELSGDEVTWTKELVRLLNKRVIDDKKMIEEYSLSDEEAEKLYFEACGLIKAIVSLRGLWDGTTSREMTEQIRAEKVDDARRVLELLKRIKVGSV